MGRASLECALTVRAGQIAWDPTGLSMPLGGGAGTTRCRTERTISPLRVGDEVEVTGMAPEDECEREMFATIRWESRGLAVPLSQLEGIAVDEETRQAIEDWHYWVARGYELG